MSARKRESGANTRKRTARGTLQSHWQQHLQTAKDSLARLRGQPTSSLMTIAVIGIALLLPSALFVTMNNLNALSSGVTSASKITLYLQSDSSDEEAIRVSEQILSREDVLQTLYISPSQAALEFSAYSGLGDVIDALDENPLPGAIVVTPATLDAEAAALLTDELGAISIVSSTQIDLQWVERLQRFLQLAQRASTGLMVILALAVLFIVGNTIRLAIEGRRAEIVVVKLVGGTNRYVARPFLYAGAYYGFAGSLLACLLLNLIMWAIRGPAMALLALYDSDFQLKVLGIGSTLLLLALGTALGWLGALISVRQHLSAIEPK